MRNLRKALEGAVQKGKSLSEMAKDLGMEEREVCFHLDICGIEAGLTHPPIITSARSRKGKPSLAEYFRSYAGQSFQDMAKELGVAHSTVEQYYQIFVKTIGG